MKHFVLTLAAMAVMGAQSATAQNKVVNLTAESTTMNVAAVTETEQTVQLSRYLFAGYNTLCLPASLTADELQQAVPGARVERLAAIGQEGTTLYLYFVDCTAEGTEAGMPYLIFSPTAKYMRVKGINAATMNEDITTVRMSDGQGNQLSFGSSWTTRQKDGLYGIPAKQNVQVLESILIHHYISITPPPYRLFPPPRFMKASGTPPHRKSHVQPPRYPLFSQRRLTFYLSNIVKAGKSSTHLHTPTGVFFRDLT